MDIAVVDDEKVIREHIGALIETHKPGSHIEACATGEELLASGKQSDILYIESGQRNWRSHCRDG